MRRIFDEDGHDVTASKRNIFRDGRANTVVIQDADNRFNITIDDLVENSFYVTSTSITGDRIQMGNCIADECGFTIRNRYGTPTTTVTASAGLTAVCDAEVFANQVSYYAGEYGFYYIDGLWVMGNAVVALADYGITLTGTPTTLSRIVVTLTVPYKYDATMFKGASLSIWIYAFDGEDKYYVPLQNFVVDTVEEVGINISVKALDMFTALNINVTPEQIKEELDFGTATVYDALKMFAYSMGLSGVTYNYYDIGDEIADYIPNGNALLVDFTDRCTNLRQILTYILEICGSCARIRNGNLDVCWYTGNTLYADWDITSENRISGAAQPNYIELTGLNVSVGQETVYSRGENTYTYTIIDNPVVEMNDSVFDAIYNARVADEFVPDEYLLYFYPFSATTLRNATIEPFDLLNYYVKNDTNRYQIIITDWTFTLGSPTQIAGRGESSTAETSESSSAFTREQKSELDILAASIEAVGENVETLESDIESLGNNVNGIDNRLSTAEDSISTMIPQLNSVVSFVSGRVKHFSLTGQEGSSAEASVTISPSAAVIALSSGLTASSSHAFWIISANPNTAIVKELTSNTYLTTSTSGLTITFKNNTQSTIRTITLFALYGTIS